MGGMIAAEMAALAPNDVSRLALICPAGLWLDDHPIVDIFSLLPFEMPAYLFHDAGGRRGDDDRRDERRATRSSCRTIWCATPASSAWPASCCSRSPNGAWPSGSTG